MPANKKKKIINLADFKIGKVKYHHVRRVKLQKPNKLYAYEFTSVDGTEAMVAKNKKEMMQSLSGTAAKYRYVR